MSTVETLMQRMRELGGSPGRHSAHLLEALAVSRHTFQQNYAELERYLAAQEDDAQQTRRIARRSPDTCEAVLNETVRLLHNYVTGAKTLVAHTRNLWDALFKEGGEFPEFQQRIDDEFKEDPLTQFVQRLRAYCLHWRPIDPGMTVKWATGRNQMTRTVSLRVEDLSEWDDWTAPARVFLRGSGREVPLLSTCRCYRDKVAAFTDWFEDCARSLRRSELEDYEARWQAFHIAELEDLIERGELQLGAPLAEHEDMLFAGVLTSVELQELAEGVTSPHERADAAIVLLGRHVSLPQSFRSRLVEWYDRASAALEY
jgi:hypothetical protein